MLRRLLLAMLLLALTGCATYETRHVYDDGYYAGQSYVYRDGSYYAPAYGAHGDYYVGQASYRYGHSYYYPYYLDSPAYYSLFWGFNRWYYDPFFYPGYYYGVTYYPRNYLSFSARRGLYRWDVGHRYFPYSPYRYAWYDHYYDWSWWHHHYPTHRHHPRPRYGSARNEAERLAWQSRHQGSGWQQGQAGYPQGLRDQRRADYTSRPRDRLDPQLGAFDGGRSAAQDSARQAARERGRQDPRLTGAEGPAVRGEPQRGERQRGPETRVWRDADGRLVRSETSPARSRDQEERIYRPAAEQRRDQARVAPDARSSSYTPRSVERASGELRREAEPSPRAQSLALPNQREQRARPPEMRQVQPPRAYAGPEAYGRPAPAPASRQVRAEPNYHRGDAVPVRSAPAWTSAPAPAASAPRSAQPDYGQHQGRGSAAPMRLAPSEVRQAPARQESRQAPAREDSSRTRRGGREED